MFAWTETVHFANYLRLFGEDQLLKDFLSKFEVYLTQQNVLAPLAQLANSQLINKTFFVIFKYIKLLLEMTVQ